LQGSEVCVENGWRVSLDFAVRIRVRRGKREEPLDESCGASLFTDDDLSTTVE